MIKSAAISAIVLALASAPVPASAQSPALALTKEERAALLNAKTVLDQRNYAAAGPAISDARGKARTPEARYLAASLELQLGIQTNNVAAQASGIEAMLASGAAPQATLEELYKNQGSLALAAGRYDRAEAAYGKWAEIAPNNPLALLALAELKDDMRKVPESAALIARAIALRSATGQPVPESWYKRGLKHAFDAKLANETIAFGQGLVTAYPTRENWRDVLLMYRELNAADQQASVDALRLMRAAKALGGERDFLDFAETLEAHSGGGEAKAALDEAVAARMVDPAKAQYKSAILDAGKKAGTGRASLAALRTKANGASATGAQAMAAADACLGAGEYAQAAEFYRKAIEKGAGDNDLANTRLGVALALAGNRTEAEAALRAVTGARAGLASYWLVWLAQGGRAA